MTHLNLSEWALRHRSMVAYLILVLMLGGVLSYFKLGREDSTKKECGLHSGNVKK
jgi:multidrug efflux pump